MPGGKEGYQPSEEDLRIRTEVGEPENREKWSVDEAHDDALVIENNDKRNAKERARGQKILDENLAGSLHGDINALKESDRGARIVEAARQDQRNNDDLGKGRLAQREKNMANNQKAAQAGRDAIERTKHGE